MQNLIKSKLFQMLSMGGSRLNLNIKRGQATEYQ